MLDRTTQPGRCVCGSQDEASPGCQFCVPPQPQPRDWATITNGELAQLSPAEQARYHVWLLNAWSAGAWSRALRSHQLDHLETINNQDWTRG